MVKNKTLQWLMVLMALLWSARGAQGRDLLQDMQLDVFALGGGSTLVNAQYFQSADRAYHSRYDLGYKVNVGAAVPYGKLLSIEAAYSYGPNNLVVTNTNVFPHQGVVYPVRDYRGTISAVFHAPFSFRGLTPYGAGGAELDRFQPTPTAITTATNQGFAATSTAAINGNYKFGLNLGGGLDHKFTKRLTFRLDVRDHVTGSPAFGLPNPQSGAIFPVKGRANNIEYTAGIVFHMGKL